MVEWLFGCIMAGLVVALIALCVIGVAMGLVAFSSLLAF